MDQNNKHGIPVGAFALGAIAGAVAGLLLAPKSGKEMRQDLKDTMEKLKDDIAQKLSQAKDITQDTYHNIVDSVVKSYEDAKKITKEEAEDIRTELQDGYQE